MGNTYLVLAKKKKKGKEDQSDFSAKFQACEMQSERDLFQTLNWGWNCCKDGYIWQANRTHAKEAK